LKDGKTVQVLEGSQRWPQRMRVFGKIPTSVWKTPCRELIQHTGNIDQPLFETVATNANRNQDAAFRESLCKAVNAKFWRTCGSCRLTAQAMIDANED